MSKKAPRQRRTKASRARPRAKAAAAPAQAKPTRAAQAQAKPRKAHEASMRDYFRFLVRNRSAAVLARFHNYDQAMEFAGLMLARCASANSMHPSDAVSVEWADDDGRKHIKTLTLTIQREEVSG